MGNKKSNKPYNSAAKIALKDISDYLASQGEKIYDKNFDVWVLTPHRMFNKETRRLNRALGIHKINKFGDRMNRF